jgi:hypothetical protein
MTEKTNGSFVVEVSEQEASTIILALLELASRYSHLLEVCEFGDHEDYADMYRERLEEVHELIQVFRAQDEDSVEIDPTTGKEV